MSDATNTATIDGIYGPTDATKNIKIGGKSAQLKTKLNINIFDLAIYGGSYVRDFSAKATESDKALAAMYDVFANAESTEEAQLEVVTIAGKMAKLGYTTTDTALLGKLNEMLAAGINFYAAELEKFALGFGVADDYNTRAAYIAKYADYVDLLPEDLSPVGADKAARIQEIVVIFEGEKATLQSYKTNSDAFIAALVGADANSIDYIYLKPIYDEAVKYYAGVYSGYPGIPEALRTYNKIAGVVELLVKNADAFIENVGIASSDAGFAVRYEAYVKARVAECEAFVRAIRAAESSTYYKTVLEQLAEAALYLDDNKEKSLDKHTGVESAVAIYDSLVEKLENSKKAADAYIAAVNAIDVNASYAALKTSVNAARALKDVGSLIGYTGVAEADAKFAEADAKLSVLEGHSSTLLYAIEALKTADTLAERRELIFIALNAKDGAEENISGVTAARAELENYIKKYNEDVARVNALFAGVVGNTADSISSVAPSDGVIISAEVIEALLK